MFAHIAILVNFTLHFEGAVPVNTRHFAGW